MDIIFDYIDKKTNELKDGLDDFQDRFISFGENVYQSGAELGSKLQAQAQDTEETVIAEFEQAQENIADFALTSLQWIMFALAGFLCLVILYLVYYCCKGKKKKITNKDSIV